MRPANSLFPLALLVLAAAPTRARAQATEAAAAAQFDQGRALMKAKKYPEACAAFETSQKLDPAMGTLYNLAACHVQIGKVATAWAEYRDLEQRDKDAARAKDSAKRAKALLPRLPKLHVDVPGKPAGLLVKLDGADITVLVGADAPVDIGMHTVEASAPGYADAHEKVTVDEEGKTVTVAVELRKPHAAEPAHPATSEPEHASEPQPEHEPEHEPAAATMAVPRHRRTGLVLAGAGVVLVGASLVVGELASSKWNDAQKVCPDATCTNASDLAQGQGLVSDARSRALIATGLAVGGVAAVGVGVALLITSRHHDAPDDTAWRVVPAVTPSSAGLAFGGSF